MLVQPFAHGKVDEKSQAGRQSLLFSLDLRLRSSLPERGGPGLEAQAGEAKLREVIISAGFTTFRRAA